VTASPTPFHAVHNLSKRLISSGSTQISERQPTSELSLKPGQSYFYTRNQSSIVAFTLPESATSESTIDFAVGHLDSCCLKIRPVSKRIKENYLQVGVELYGGGIWATWFDRDLSIAGRVIVAQPNAASGEPSFVSKLVKIDRPMLRIPNLAIHLDRTINEAFKFNKETQFRPILGLVADQLNESKGGRSTPMPFSGRTSPVQAEQGVKETSVEAKMEDKHHPLMLAVLADELGCSIGDIHDFEL
jgi:aspartyl aminopeptidase